MYHIGNSHFKNFTIRTLQATTAPQQNNNNNLLHLHKKCTTLTTGTSKTLLFELYKQQLHHINNLLHLHKKCTTLTTATSKTLPLELYKQQHHHNRTTTINFYTSATENWESLLNLSDRTLKSSGANSKASSETPRTRSWSSASTSFLAASLPSRDPSHEAFLTHLIGSNEKIN